MNAGVRSKLTRTVNACNAFSLPLESLIQMHQFNLFILFSLSYRENRYLRRVITRSSRNAWLETSSGANALNILYAADEDSIGIKLMSSFNY
jgi:hypothetical protein